MAISKTAKRDRYLLSITTDVLAKTTGKKTFVKQGKGLIRIDVDSCFEKKGIGVPDEPTKKTLFEVFALVEEDTFSRVFRSLGVDLPSLAFTPNQIIDWVQKHSCYIHEGYSAYFLRKVGESIFVVEILSRSGYPHGFEAYSHRLSEGGGHSWSGKISDAQNENRDVFVVPQQPLTAA